MPTGKQIHHQATKDTRKAENAFASAPSGPATRSTVCKGFEGGIKSGFLLGDLGGLVVNLLLSRRPPAPWPKGYPPERSGDGRVL
jgi:hypothetical protein